MTTLPMIDRISLVVRELVDRPGQDEGEVSRPRRMVEALVEFDLASAMALWKRFAKPGSDDIFLWKPLIERGERDVLPRPERIASAISGGQSPELPQGTRVLYPQGGTHALVLGQTDLREEDLDLLGSLLVVLDVMEDPAGDHEAMLEDWASVLSGRGCWPGTEPL